MNERLVLVNKLQEVDKMTLWLEEIYEKAQVDEMKRFNITLSLEEVVVNVINYAYPDREAEFTLDAEYEPGGELKFVLKDCGVAFDPTAKEDPDITQSAEDRPIGGLGIFLVKELMSSVSYERVDGQNVLTIIV